MNDYINKYISSQFIVLCGKQGKKIDATIYNDYSGEPYNYIGDE
jgi:hypothetical protein